MIEKDAKYGGKARSCFFIMVLMLFLILSNSLCSRNEYGSLW